MPRPAREQEAVLSGRLLPEDIYQNARYDAGYRMGWRDAHRTAGIHPAHRRTREKYREYATGYAHGWEGGKGHPCPEWDEQHRTGKVRDMPDGCPWGHRPGVDPIALAAFTRHLDKR